MIYYEFRKAFYDQGCFTSNQIFTWRPTLDKNTTGRWVKKGLLVKLRNGIYTFPEYLEKPNFALFVANKIYRPSYISTYTALSFYGLIPETIAHVTSITTMKTATFQNTLGTYIFQSIAERAMFGIDLLPFDTNKILQIAKPEKALLDLIYLNPQYQTPKDMEELRLDESLFEEVIHTELLQSYAGKYQNTALFERLNTLLKVYSL